MIYLYDALYCIKEETDYVKLKEELGIMEAESLKEWQIPYKQRWYIVDEDINNSKLHAYHSSLKLNKEIWVELKDSNGEYFISNYGRILSLNIETLKSKFIMSTSKLTSSGKDFLDKPYSKEANMFRRRYVRLKINGRWREFLVARLVASHFLPSHSSQELNIDNYITVHKNGVLYDDFVENLYLERKGKHYSKLFSKEETKERAATFYLFDCLYGIKQKTTSKNVIALFNISEDNIEESIDKLMRERVIFKNRWTLIDGKTKRAELYNIQESIKTKNEIWRRIKGTDLEYKISNLGRIKQFSEDYPEGKLVTVTAKLIDPKKVFANDPFSIEANKCRRRYVKLLVNGKEKEFQVSRLVASHFLEEAFSDDFNIKDYVVIHENNFLYCDKAKNLRLEKKSDYLSKIPKPFEVKVEVKCLQTGEVNNYKSINEASRNIGYPTIEICDVLNKNVENRVSEKYLIKRIER